MNVFEQELTFDQLEKAYLEFLLKKYEHNRRKMAIVLGYNHETVYRRLKKYDLHKGPERQGYRRDLVRKESA